MLGIPSTTLRSPAKRDPTRVRVWTIVSGFSRNSHFEVVMPCPSELNGRRILENYYASYAPLEL